MEIEKKAEKQEKEMEKKTEKQEPEQEKNSSGSPSKGVPAARAQRLLQHNLTQEQAEKN